MDMLAIFAGLLLHHLVLLSNLHTVKHKDLSCLIWFYISERPVKLLISIVGAVMGYVLIKAEFAALYAMASTPFQVAEIDSKYYITLISTGYISDSIVDRLGSQASQKLKL